MCFSSSSPSSSIWRRAQRLFVEPNDEERVSSLRKLYLYAAVLAGVLSAVSNATFVLTGFLRQLLGLPPEGDIRIPLPIILVTVLWGYHATCCGRRGPQPARRRASRHPAHLPLPGPASGWPRSGRPGRERDVIIRSVFGGRSASAARTGLVHFGSARFGLPVWLLPWRRAQSWAVSQGAAGLKPAVVRKII
jgi:hypothetical protein